MHTVTGVGGFFFRSDDPAALAAWYARHLGVTQVPQSYDDPVWHQHAGPTVFAPFERDTDYFGDPAQGWMINFRVADLEGMVAQLRAAGIAVEVDPTPQPNGWFARLHDPDGNPIELWQPKEIETA